MSLDLLKYSLKSDNSLIISILQGEVKSSKIANLGSLPIPSFKSTQSALKMLYYALSDYSINTAGRIYHEAGIFRTSIDSWEPNVSIYIGFFKKEKGILEQ